MSQIKSLYRDYIQKSRIFLYPALGIKRGVSVTPIQTYLTWKGKFVEEDNRFICLYHKRDDKDYLLFEKVKLLSNPLFETMIEIDDESIAYVFNFSEFRKNYQMIIQGKYSKISTKHKQKILSFFKNLRSHHVYIESYLYPEKFIPMYAELLAGNKAEIKYYKNLLEEVGELCSPPDLIKEQLIINNKHRRFKKNLLDLQ